ncbi:unnamed protein product [Cylicocyclus nassatus]|uniref:Uncharacterized protein n=1 Tax=Cylicocyclus nassatus TaxID=53992 RepID=A0AA36MET6_CYLNA|nr:unnamed protein product [Cylicocyclus nassatus]
MVLERAIALWKRSHYEASGSALGFVIAGSSIFAGAALAIWSLIQMDLRKELVYCTVSNSATAYRLQIRSYALCGINLVALFFSGLVFFFNAAAVRKRYINLRSSYQLRENIDVITVIIPLSVIHSICHLLLSIAGVILFANQQFIPTVTFWILLTATYIVPYYTLISPLILLLLLKLSSRKRATKLITITKTPSENETFTAYSKMWEVVAIDKY